MEKTKTVVIGGGTGTFVSLTGLKKYPLDLAAIVTMMDDGGSSGRLRDQLGVLPPGDLRQCLVALSEASDVWRKLFTYRFEKGDFQGHNFGNILLSVLEKVSENYEDAIEEAHRIMNVAGRVIPITFDKSYIRVEYESGRMLSGESLLDEQSADGSSIHRAYLTPKASIYTFAKDALYDADFIIAGPGDLYSSIIAIALVSGVKEIFQKTKAKIIFNINLMTKSSQTPGYTVTSHINDFATYFGRVPDAVVLNSAPISSKLVNFYKKSGDEPVRDDLNNGSYKGIVIRENLISKDIYMPSDDEVLAKPYAHSIVRHDAELLALAIIKAQSLLS